MRSGSLRKLCLARTAVLVNPRLPANLRTERSVTLLSDCGQTHLKPKHIERLKEIGQFIHSGNRPLVFDGGHVGTTQCSNEEIYHESQVKPSRPQARSWQGRSARSGAWTPAQGNHFGSPAIEASHGAELRVLAQAYPVVVTESDDGFWLAIRTKPLGPDGPKAHVLIAVSCNRSVLPRAWAFETIGTQPRPFAPKHTNFPDGSICAFAPTSDAWKPEDGLLDLVDHYVIWMIKSWHRTVFGWWPGKQAGVVAFYRAQEFDGREFCGCGSGLLYAFCHRGRDLAVPEEVAQKQFETAFGCSYFSRAVPAVLLDAAKSNWRKLPSIRSALGLQYPDLHSIRRAA